MDPTCKLCLAAPETRQHFIAECSAYEQEGGVHAMKLRNNPVLPDELKSDLLNPELFTQLTLDASFYINGRENLEALELRTSFKYELTELLHLMVAPRYVNGGTLRRKEYNR